MKRYALAAIAVATMLPGAARTLSPQEALGRLKSEETLGSGSAAARALAASSLKPELLKTVATATGDPAVYVFGDHTGKGYFVLPADDMASPLLGYSDRGLPADAEMPEQMRWWLSEYARQIEYARRNPVGNNIGETTAIAGNAEAESLSARASRQPIGPLLTTTWNQDSPYNNDCPVVNGAISYTGCVATAMAQILNYHEWPVRGTGTATCEDSSGQKYSMTFTQDFDWNNMLDSYSGNSTLAQRKAVSYLMKACGYASKMVYSPQGSGANTYYAAAGMTDNLGYDADKLTLVQRDYVPLSEWTELIYNELKNNGPVYYTGVNSAYEGHAFVCDGYTTGDYFHFNWGWGGMADGYFLLTALNPDELGAGGGSGSSGFDYMQDVIIGIGHPSKVVKPAYDVIIVTGGTLTASIESGTISIGVEEQGSGFYNNTYKDLLFDVGIAFENEATNAIQYSVAATEQTIPMGYGFSGFGSQMPQLASGIYRVYPVARINGTTTWTKMPAPVSNIQYLLLTVDGTEMSLTRPDDPGINFHNVELPEHFYLKLPFRIKATITNNSDETAADEFAPAFCTLSGNQLSIIARGETTKIQLAARASTNFDLTSNYVDATRFRTGNYHFVIYSTLTGKIYYYQTVTVEPAPDSVLAIETDADEAISMEFDRAASTARFTAETGIASVDATDLAGKALNAATTVSETEAAADLSGLPGGVVLLTVSDNNGNTQTFKIAL